MKFKNQDKINNNKKVSFINKAKWILKTAHLKTLSNNEVFIYQICKIFI